MKIGTIAQVQHRLWCSFHFRVTFTRLCLVKIKDLNILKVKKGSKIIHSWFYPPISIFIWSFRWKCLAKAPKVVWTKKRFWFQDTFTLGSKIFPPIKRQLRVLFMCEISGSEEIHPDPPVTCQRPHVGQHSDACPSGCRSHSTGWVLRGNS